MAVDDMRSLSSVEFALERMPFIRFDEALDYWYAELFLAPSFDPSFWFLPPEGLLKPPVFGFLLPPVIAEPHLYLCGDATPLFLIDPIECLLLPWLMADTGRGPLIER